MASVTVDFAWHSVGDIYLDGLLRFPRLDDAPGLYRFEVAEEVYVGETECLARRMQNYRTPGPSQATNIRINAWLLSALRERRPARLSVVLGGTLVLGDRRRLLNLNQKADRVLAEHAALLLEVAAGCRLRNALSRGGR